MKNNETGDIIMRRLLSVVMVSAMVISLAACSSSGTDSENAGGQASSAEAGAVQETSRENGDVTADDGQAGEVGQDEPLKIAFFMFENSNTFTTYIRKGLESYGKENNVTVDSFDGKSDQSTQTDAITTALAKGEYDLIVVNPVDSGAGTTINNLCRDNNVPVIFADRAPDLVGGVLDEYEQSYYVGLDWSDPGKVQAEMLYEDWKADPARFDKNGDGVLQYVLLQGNVAQQNAIYRTEAIHTLMDQWNGDGTLKNEELDIQDGNWSSDKGKDVMDTWNVKYGDQIEAVLCNNDTMAMGAIESLKTAGAFDGQDGPAVYGINGIPDVWEMVESGHMAGTVLTSPYREAVAIIDMSRNICAGKDPLEGTDLEWGEFGKDVRISDIPIRIDNLDTAKDDFSKCMTN
jgi:methyl-galactoside transport system substrate-binding protein